MQLEFDILHALQTIHNDILDSIMLFVTRLGDGGFIWIAAGLLLLLIPAVGKESKEHARERRIAGLMILLTLVVEALIVNIGIKNIVGRLRPFQVDTSVIPLITPGETSFPSGHTASSFAAATAVFLYKKKPGTIALILATAIAFTRLYLFVHFPTDVLAGMFIGIVVAVLMNRFVKPAIVNKINAKMNERLEK